jgi:hypothetical protein
MTRAQDFFEGVYQRIRPAFEGRSDAEARASTAQIRFFIERLLDTHIPHR